MTVDFVAWPWSVLPRDFMVELLENLSREDYSQIEKAKSQRKIKRLFEQNTHQGYRSDLKSGKGLLQVNLCQHKHGVDGIIGDAYGESYEIVRQRRRVLEWAELYPHRYGSVLKQLDSDAIAVSDAFRKIDRDLKRQAIINTAPKISLPKQFRLYRGDFSVKQSKIPQNSIDLIFTDPPYDKASLGLYLKLARFASYVLKDGACLVTYAAQYYLPEIVSIFAQERSLRYLWMPAVRNSGRSARIFRKRIFACYKPLLIYVKGKARTCDDFLPDMVEPKSRSPEKLLHPWEQGVAEAEHFIRFLTYEGQVVCDPMLGSGTTGISALGLQRRFLITSSLSTLRVFPFFMFIS